MTGMSTAATLKSDIRNWWATNPMTYAAEHGVTQYGRADGTVEVVEMGVAGRGRAPTGDPRGEQQRVEASLLPGARERTQAILERTLDSLGQAHHRPFSRE